ncbi:vWA domain-containing protein [Cupriavidus alkaliphilus]|uniref:Ca-activated chloride channel family protein n=1 Tax=Cupriavidus alkaliphilus TaxID=942866 RepID=A0A7W4YTC0_9BURK|nr:VWA domain-containing protein [Cupriavidus alkaliphilus]MBB3009031.1 Ca-activated chloride channel family protein [Cupriavidus alkaliphilus]PVY79439.1 Ca-activated chloride channel family protein [Cupriavidus alkaliphilus]SCB23238.1 Ca-activated chloride channel family protein [Cupriavidus alkaliphilus]
MQFLWPQMLWLLLALPVLAAAYLYLLARRKKAALLYASLALPRAALGPRQRLRRHIPPLLFFLALAAALLACARPSATITLPADTVTLVLAMDTSRSMEAADVPPNRISAAQQAARDLVVGLPASVRLGIVSFAGTAAVVLPPTDNRQDMLDAIDRFQLQRGTATGSGLFQALAVLFPEDGIDLEVILFGSRSDRAGRGTSLDEAAAADAARRREQNQQAAQPGSYPHGAVILLSDGRRTTGPDPLDAARMAAQRGVRVYTVGFGSQQVTTAPESSLAYFMQLDEPALRAVAAITGGEYFHAGSAADLSQVYRQLSARFALERRETELGALFAAAAVVLLAVACGLSMLWFRR